MKKIILLLLLSPAFIWAQQEYDFTQYFNNYSFINPAATGINEHGHLSLQYRKQWTGINGSPQIGLISYDTPIFETFKGSGGLSIGGFISNDQIGIVSTTKSNLNIAYQLPINKVKMSFGLNGGFDYYTANYNKLIVWEEADEKFANNVNGAIIPQVGAGLVFFGEKWKAGISVPRILNINTNKAINTNTPEGPSFVSHYYAFGEYTFNLGEKFTLTPSTMLKYVPNAPFQAQISAMAGYNKLIEFGFAYRTLSAVSCVVQFNIKDFMRIGYSFDLSTSAYTRFANGSHEASISFFIKSKKEKVSESDEEQVSPATPEENQESTSEGKESPKTEGKKGKSNWFKKLFKRSRASY